MSDWGKNKDGNGNDNDGSDQQGGAATARKKRSSGGNVTKLSRASKGDKKKDPDQIVLPHVCFDPDDVFLKNLEGIRANHGATVPLIKPLVPPSCIAIDRTTTVEREDGSIAFIELRLEHANGGKSYRAVFPADVMGSVDARNNGTGLLRTDFKELAAYGLYIPTNAPDLLEAQRAVAESEDLTLAIFWCEGSKAGEAFAARLKTPEAQRRLAEKRLVGVAAATLGGASGARYTNYALRPRAGTHPRFIVEGKNSTALRVETALHYIVRDADEAGLEEAMVIVNRLQKEFGVPLEHIHVVEPPPEAPEGWDDADTLPEGVTEVDRLSQVFETLAIGNTWAKFKVGSVWPDGLNKENMPKATMRNAMFAIEEIGHTIRHDQFRLRDYFNDAVLSNVHLIALRDEIANKFDYDPGKDPVADAVLTLAQRNAHHPLMEYFETLRWDGTPRIGKWMTRYLSAADTELNSEIGKLMLVAAIRRVKQPGCKFDTIVVLEGDQGTGKSSALRVLASPAYFSDADVIHLPSKDQAERLQGVWIQEIAELVGLSKADVNAIKNFASRQVDRTRPAYARVVEDFPRTCILVGTTNEEAYLRDLTGNRRFWPVKTGAVDLLGLLQARDQLWAEALEMERNWGELMLPEHLWGAAEGEQQARMTVDYLSDVLARLTPENCTVEGHNNEYYRITYTAVFEFVQERTREQWSRIPYPRLDSVMKRLGWETNKFVQCTIYEGGVTKKKQLRAFQRRVDSWDLKEHTLNPMPHSDTPF